MTYRDLLLTTVALSSAAFLGTRAVAQDVLQPAPAAQAPQTAAPQDPTDIIVTARKRQESILKVPVVETALSQATLEKFQTQDLNDIAKRVPGLVIGQAVLSIGTQVSIRGVGTSSLDAGVDQSISLNIDGLQLSQGLAYKVGTFDLGQAEVLKGPQALFFGKSSPGGVISLRTADPTHEAELIARGSYEFYTHERRFEAIASGPVADTLLVRLSGLYSKDDGYFRNVAVAAPGLGGVTPSHRDVPSESYIGRLTAIWQPTSEFSARLKANYAHDRVNGNGGDGQYLSCPDGYGRAPAFGIPFLAGNENCHKDRDFNYVWMSPAAFQGIVNNGEPFSSETQKFGTLELNYLPSSTITLTSVSGYYKLDQQSLINGVESTYAGPTLSASNQFSRHDFTQELRANSSFAGPLNFTLGGFYQDSTERNFISVLGNTFLGLPAVLTRGTHKLDINSYSLFGQARYKIVPTLELSGGLRWTHEKRSDTVFNIPGSGIATQVALPTPSIRSSNYSPEVTLTWTPQDNMTVFGSLKQAYKSGSYSITTIPAPGVDNSFGDEKVQGGEIGLKTRSVDRRFSANLAGYYYHYTGLQVGANEPAQNGVPILRTLNAGSLNTYGIDFDADYRPEMIEGLDLHGAVNWNHARFKKLTNAPCWGGQSIAEGCNLLLNPATGAYTAQDLSGNAPVRAPNWQVNFGFDYDMQLSNGMHVTFSSANTYSSRYLTDLLARSDFYQKGYLLTDATIALRNAKNSWEVALIGKNLSNRLTTGNCTNFNAESGQIFGGENTGRAGPRGAAGVDETTCQVNPGRQIFIRFTLHPRFGR